MSNQTSSCPKNKQKRAAFMAKPSGRRTHVPLWPRSPSEKTKQPEFGIGWQLLAVTCRDVQGLAEMCSDWQCLAVMCSDGQPIPSAASRKRTLPQARHAQIYAQSWATLTAAEQEHKSAASFSPQYSECRSIRMRLRGKNRAMSFCTRREF